MAHGEQLVACLCQAQSAVDGTSLAREVRDCVRQTHLFTQFFFGHEERLPHPLVFVIDACHFKLHRRLTVVVSDGQHLIVQPMLKVALFRSAASNQDKALPHFHVLGLVGVGLVGIVGRHKDGARRGELVVNVGVH